MGWTTASAKNASVWNGPNVWKADWDQNQMDFHSAVIVGDKNVNVADVVVAKPVVVKHSEPKVDVVIVHPSVHGSV